MNLPLSFKGLDGDQEVYNDIVRRNMRYQQIIYMKVEDEFVELTRHLNTLHSWNAISYLDLNTLSQSLSTVEAWKFNLNALQQKKNEIQLLPD